MTYYIYILYSESSNKIYIGMSSDPEKRLFSHNNLPKGWTKSYRPWQMVYKEEFLDKSLALQREKELKSHQGIIFIRREILKQG